MAALDSLKAQRLIRFVLPSHGRTAVRYRHVLNEALGLDQRQCALLAVLVLRGPQTIGELRARTERMADFDGLDEIDHELRFLSTVAEPLATSLGRRPGQKEERWVTPLVAPAPASAPVPLVVPTVTSAPAAIHDDDPGGPVEYGSDGPDGARSDGARSDAHDPFGDLRSEIAALRAEVDGLRRDLSALRHQPRRVGRRSGREPERPAAPAWPKDFEILCPLTPGWQPSRTLPRNSGRTSCPSLTRSQQRTDRRR